MAFSELTAVVICITFTVVMFGITLHGLAAHISSIVAPPQLGFAMPELSSSKGFQAQALGFQEVPLQELRLVYVVYGDSSGESPGVYGEVQLIQKAGDSDLQRIRPGEMVGSGSLIGVVPGSRVDVQIVHKPSGVLLFSANLVARS